MKVFMRIINKASDIKAPRQVQQKLKSKWFIGLDKATVKSLESMSAEEFFPKACQRILKPTGIPEKCYPPVVFEDLSRFHSQAIAAYDLCENYLSASTKFLKRSSAKKFATCSHELTHYVQSVNIYRTAGLGEEAVKKYSSELAKEGNVSYEAAYSKLENLRKNLVAEMGEISPDSKEGKRAKKLFTEFISDSRPEAAEREAHRKRNLAYFEYLYAKFFK